MRDYVAEVVNFRIKEGLAIDRFLEAVAKTTEFLRRQPGFLGRELLHVGEAVEWLDIVRWASLTDAQRAAEVFGVAPECAEFNDTIVGESLVIRHMVPAPLVASTQPESGERGQGSGVLP